MRNFILGVLVALSLSAIAVTDNPDGSVTFTHEEAANLLENFQRMDADSEQYAKDRAIALQVLQNMQRYIDKLEKKCSPKEIES
jgi:hypothetical protein